MTLPVLPSLPTEMNSATLSWVTPKGDEVIAYHARMSATKNQSRMKALSAILKDSNDPKYRDACQKELDGLTKNLILRCVRDGHFSVLEQASMSVIVRTTRRLAPQFFRHHSFRFQEFSQRYAIVPDDIPMPDLRLVDGAKRNPSIEPKSTPANVVDLCQNALRASYTVYRELLGRGYHPESAAFFLPLCTPTIFSMSGNIRDWFFYLKSRTSVHAQKEHQDVANCILGFFKEEFPIVYQAYVEYSL